ncbi:MAG: VTT domain-containing protein [Methylococcales bacterium]|nr:VTT domain-containing protein [Methylococcales bacterium]
MASFPTLPLNVLAGLLYGTWVGGGIVVTGAVIGSYLTYVLVRIFKKKRRHSFEEDSLYAKLANHDFDYKTIIFFTLKYFFTDFFSQYRLSRKQNWAV